MNKTRSYFKIEEDQGISWVRVFGMVVVLSFHVAVGLVLLAPVGAVDDASAGFDVVQVVIIDPPKPPPPPPPPPPTPPEIKKVVREPVRPLAVKPPKPQIPQQNTPVSQAVETPVVFDDPQPLDTVAPPPEPPSPSQTQGDTPSLGVAPGTMTLNAIVSPKPPYPRDALREHFEGEVILRITVGPDGVPVDVSIEHSSGHRAMDRDTMSFVKRKWRFQATGQREVGILPVRFQLD